MRSLCFVLLLLTSTLLQAANYELKDLNVLKERMQWEVLLEHIDDIAPTKQHASWQSLFELTVKKRFDELLKKSEDTKTMTFLHKYLKRTPKLKKDRVFMQKRADFGLKYFDACLSYNDQQCHQAFLQFVKEDSYGDFAFKVAKLVRLRLSDTQAIHYFILAKSLLKDTLCEDKDLSLSVEKSLTLDSSRPEVKYAQTIAFGQCRKKLKSAVKNAIRSHKNGIINSCKKAVKYQMLSGITLKKCKRYLQTKGQ